MKTTIISALIALAVIIGGVGVASAQTTRSADISLAWAMGAVAADNSNAPDGVKVERKVGTDAYQQIGQIGVVTSYVDTIAADPGNTQYCYRVRSFNSAGDSAYSNEACITTPVIIVVPNPPTGLSIKLTIK